MAVAPRDVTPFISWLRNFFGGRKVHSVHRFEMLSSPRSPPLPNMPPGTSHALSANSYHLRDGRRYCQPPRLAYDPKALASGEPSQQQTALPTGVKLLKPGFGYDWKTGGDLYKP